MTLQRIVGPKELLLNLWLDLERCVERAAFTFDEDVSEFEQLVIILEDRRYLSHNGIDYRSIARILVQQVAGSRRGGASTIEMQLVRTVTGRYERTFRRKLREIVLARLLCFHCTKLEILRGYLNIAYFGRNTIGADAAALRIFGKYLDTLSEMEASMIASLLVYPAPEDLENEKWTNKVKRRANYGLRLLTAAKQRRK